MIQTKKDKKFWKRFAKKHIENRSHTDERLQMNGLINLFVRTDDGTSGTDYYIFEGTNIKTVREELENYINIDGVNWTSMYDCTGRYFSHPIDITVLPLANRIIVTQWWGYDV